MTSPHVSEAAVLVRALCSSWDGHAHALVLVQLEALARLLESPGAGHAKLIVGMILDMLHAHRRGDEALTGDDRGAALDATDKQVQLVTAAKEIVERTALLEPTPMSLDLRVFSRKSPGLATGTLDVDGEPLVTVNAFQHRPGRWSLDVVVKMPGRVVPAIVYGSWSFRSPEPALDAARRCGAAAEAIVRAWR